MSRNLQRRFTSGGTTSRSDSLVDGEDYHESESAEQDSFSDYDTDQDLGPEDSASVSPHRSYRQQPQRAPSRYHTLPHHTAYPPPYRPGSRPNLPGSVDPSEEYHPSAFAPARGGYGHNPAGHAPVPPGHGGPHNPYYGRGHPQAGFPQSHVGGYMTPYGPHANQMVPYGCYNPFSPMSNGNGQSYFQQEPRNSYDMMQYQQPQPPAFYNPPYQVPQHLTPFLYPPAPPPPPTEPPVPSKTPGPAPESAPPPPDPEKIKLQEEIERYKKEQALKEEAERQRLLEEKIKRDAEEALQRRMDELKKIQEENEKKLAKAKKEAEQAAREAIEAERKAEEQRQKLQAEAMERAERKVREKYEAELKAEADRKAAEAKARADAEVAAQLKLDLAIKAKEDARIAAEKKAAEEAAAKAKYEADMKAQAEKEAREKLEAEKKAAEEAAAAKAKYEADMKAQAEKEAREKLEKEKQAAADAAAAAEEAKKAEEKLKKTIAEETKAQLEADSKKKEGKAPIKFKDAVGRKFNFPFHLCSTWTGMEELIKQAFVHVDVIGMHVQEGHYDLIGPNGEIILPQVWEKVVEPDWTIEMRMWPMDKPPPVSMPFPMRRDGRVPAQQPHGHRPPFVPGMPGFPRPVGGGEHHPGHPDIMGRGRGHPPPPPPHMRQGGMPMGEMPDIVTVKPPDKKPKAKAPGGKGFVDWMVGKNAPKKKRK